MANVGNNEDLTEAEDFKAHALLATNFYDCKGVFVRNKQSHQPTREEFEALSYLCDEWDYGYEGGWVTAS